MKAHIIIANPNKNSFNYALFDAIKNDLIDKGYNIDTSDLYDFFRNNNQVVQPFDISLDNSSGLSFKNNDINKEQKIIKNSELTIIQFPIYWFSFPSLVHSYLEQVLTPGFAYPGKFNESPLFDGRKLMLSVTTQSPKKDYSDNGPIGNISDILYPIHTAFRFVGYKILEPFVSYSVADNNKQENQSILENIPNHLSKVLD